MKDGSTITDELAVANAHSLGATPWQWADYIRKFETLTDGVLDRVEARRFLQTAQDLTRLRADQLAGLNIALPSGTLAANPAKGIF